MKNSSENNISKAVFKFHGGIHPAENKSISNSQASTKLTPDCYFRIPINQSSLSIIDLQTHLTVKKGQKVVRGEALTDYKVSDNFGNVPVHSPCDGEVTEIGLFNCSHPSEMPEMTVVIKSDIKVESKAVVNESTADWQKETVESLLFKIRDSGIVGLGGAVFPAHIKQSSFLKSNDLYPATLIVNAMECEPFITCDDRLIREQAKSIIEGARIVCKIVNCQNIVFAIEDNKAEAIQALQEAVALEPTNISAISILVAPTKYPSGGEKQVIQIVTGKELTKKQRPKDLNILVQNVATLFAIYQSIVLKEHLTERLVTITGDRVPQPGNYWIPFGTSISHIISHLNISKKGLDTVIIGGPLMGQKTSNFNTPTSKKANCLIFDMRTPPTEIKDCIRCGECETVCPIKLLPQQLYWFSKTEQWQSIEQLNLDACIECGACDYVCPSNIPLVNFFQFAKSEVKHNLKKEKASEIAKLRFENREKRLIRIKQDRKEKQKKNKLNRQKASENKVSDPDGKKAAILAALNRVKNKSGTKND